jgi:F-type H+-transporting ATPase subunit b
MLEIQPKWFLVLLVNFLALIYILNIILFKPLLKLFKEGEDIVKGSLDATREMNRRKEEDLEKMSREISEARNRAKENFEKLKEEGLSRQKELLSETETSAASMLEKAREELTAEAERARKALKGDIEKFSDDIVRKLIKA